MPVKIQREIRNILIFYDAPLNNLQLFEIKIFITRGIVFNIRYDAPCFWTPLCLIFETENSRNPETVSGGGG
jgi:hypothetical protein